MEKYPNIIRVLFFREFVKIQNIFPALEPELWQLSHSIVFRFRFRPRVTPPLPQTRIPPPFVLVAPAKNIPISSKCFFREFLRIQSFSSAKDSNLRPLPYNTVFRFRFASGDEMWGDERPRLRAS